MTPRTVAFHTLGCKLNYSETSAIARLFEGSGYLPVKFEDGADIYVLNTCSVTEQADKECKKIVRQALRQQPDAFVVVTGCYAQLKPQEIADIPGVDLVLGAGEKFRILDFVDDLSKAQGKGMVQAGQTVTVNAAPYRDGTEGGYVIAVTLADGTFFGMKGRAQDAQRTGDEVRRQAEGR